MPLTVHTLDLQFLSEPHLLASYLIQQGDANILIESGPGSTLPALTQALKAHGLAPTDLTHVLLTHIHLDHAGGAGWLAEQGADVYVHEIGARHMLDPSRLWSSATRIYGEDMMAFLWGEMRPVPQDKLHILQDNDTVSIEGLDFQALYTPGHASHHLAYLLDDLCFTGDVAGCALPGLTHVRVPTPPPDLDLALWDASLTRLEQANPKTLFLTHFGQRDDAIGHLKRCRKALHDLRDFVKPYWEQGAPKTDAIEAYFPWIEEQAKAVGASEEELQRFQNIAGAKGNVGGFYRYFSKCAEASSS